MTRMQRFAHQMIRLTLLIACCAMMASCGSGGRHKVVIRFWNGFTGPDGRAMLKIIKRFNEQNPDVEVLMQRMDWGTYYNKLFVAGIGNRAPEVFVVHASNLERFMQADFVQPVDDLMQGPEGLPEKDFVPNVWKAMERKGKHYAVPLDVHALGMYYNKKLLREAGITDAQGNAAPPTDRASFEAALRKITKPDIGQWGYTFTWFRTNVYALAEQNRAQFFNDTFTSCTMDSPPVVKTLEWCSDLIEKQHLAPQPENFNSWIGFRQGKVGMVFEGTYMLADLQKQKDLDWGAAPIPTIGETSATWADSHSMCLRKNMDKAHLDASWRLVRFLSDNSLDWAEGGQIPVRESLLKSQRFEGMYAQREFARQLPYIHYMPSVPFIFEFLTEFDLATEKALRGTVTSQQALDVATKNVDEVIERRRSEK